MFIKNLNKASFFIVVPFFIFSFNNEINAQVKYVFHNKANLKLNRKYSIPRIAKKSVQTLKSNIIKSNSTNNIKLSGVKIINNKDFKNELSNISSKIGSPTKVETTTISGVEIILGSSNYLANNNKSSNKIRKTVQNKVVRPSTKATVRYNPSTNYIDNEDLFKDSPWEENNETTTEEIAPEPINEIVQEEVDHFETTEEEIESIEETVLEESTTEEIESIEETVLEESTTEEIESIEETVLEETTIEEIESIEETVFEETTIEEIESIEETVLEESTTEEIAPESTNEIVQKEVDPFETTEEEIESIEETVLEETTTEEIDPEPTNEIVQKEVDPFETTEEEIESIEETVLEETTKEEIAPESTNEIAPESTNEIVQEEVDPLETAEEEIESIEETVLEETTKEEVAPEPTNEIVQEEVDPLETTEEEIESIEETVLEETTTEEVAPEPFEENTTNEVENLRFKVSESAKIENDLAEKANLYYTVRVKSVSNPADGLKFLMEIKDNDAVWDEHTFHLFKDQENENITNISLGKFVNKQKAENLMEYLKTKNIKNPSIEKYENKIAPKISNKVPNKKPVSTIRSSSEIETPINKVVKNPETKKEISSNKNLLDNISSKVDETENYFSVQVGANDKISSTNIQGLNLNKEKLFFVNIEKGKYAINYGKHNDYGSAHKIALEIHKKGLQTAFVTKYENGVRVKISKKDYLTDKTPKKTISDDINQLGYLPIGPNDKGKFVQIGTIYNWNAHNFKPLYDQLERTIYYKIKENNSLIFLVGPLQESEVFIELRTIKQIISDAFIKTL